MTPDSPTNDIAKLAIQAWQRQRRRLFRAWLLSIAGAVATGTLLIINLTSDGSLISVNLRSHSNVALVALLIAAALCIRSAWRVDRLIRECDRKIRGPDSHDTVQN
jgi:hypothetical protein